MTPFMPFTDAERDALKRCGVILSQSLGAVVAAIRPGMSTMELDEIAERVIRGAGATPSFLGYQGYPASLCVSVNDEVVHGIPKSDAILKDGDVVGLDLGAQFEGMHTDMATTVAVGTPSQDVERLIDATRRALAAGLKAIRNGCTTGDIGAAVQSVVEKEGFGVVRDLVGHGVGRHIHEEPSIPNFGMRGTGERISEGMALAVEPMVTAGGYAVVTDADGWTVRTRDGSRAAHEERTVLVTKRGFELITPWDHGKTARH